MKIFFLIITNLRILGFPLNLQDSSECRLCLAVPPRLPPGSRVPVLGHLRLLAAAEEAADTEACHAHHPCAKVWALTV